MKSTKDILEKVNEYGEIAGTLEATRKTTLESRAGLVANTKQFRALSSKDDQLKQLPKLVRQYQLQIDALQKRAEGAEKAFEDAFSTLRCVEEPLNAMREQFALEAQENAQRLAQAAGEAATADHVAQIQSLQAKLNDSETMVATLREQGKEELDEIMAELSSVRKERDAVKTSLDEERQRTASLVERCAALNKEADRRVEEARAEAIAEWKARADASAAKVQEYASQLSKALNSAQTAVDEQKRSAEAADAAEARILALQHELDSLRAHAPSTPTKTDAEKTPTSPSTPVNDEEPFIVHGGVPMTPLDARRQLERLEERIEELMQSVAAEESAADAEISSLRAQLADAETAATESLHHMETLSAQLEEERDDAALTRESAERLGEQVREAEARADEQATQSAAQLDSVRAELQMAQARIEQLDAERADAVKSAESAAARVAALQSELAASQEGGTAQLDEVRAQLDASKAETLAVKQALETAEAARVTAEEVLAKETAKCAQLALLVEERSGGEEELANVRAQLDETRHELEKARASVDEERRKYDAVLDEVQSAERQRAAAVKERDAEEAKWKETVAAQSASLQAAIKETEALRQQQLQTEAALRDANVELDAKSADVVRLEARVSELEKRDAHLVDELQIKNDEIETHRKEAAEALERMATAEAELSDARTALEARPSTQQMEELKRIADEARSEETKARASVDQLRADADAARKEAAEARTRLNALMAESGGVADRLEALQVSLQRAEQRNTTLSEELESAQQRADESVEGIATAERDVEAARNDRDEWRRRFEQLQVELASASDHRGEAEREAASVRRELGEAMARLEAQQEMIDELSAKTLENDAIAGKSVEAEANARLRLTELEAEISKRDEELEQSRARIDELEANVDSLQSQLTSASAAPPSTPIASHPDLVRSQQESERLRRENAQLGTRVQEQDSEILELKQRLNVALQPASPARSALLERYGRGDDIESGRPFASRGGAFSQCTAFLPIWLSNWFGGGARRSSNVDEEDKGR